MASNKRLLAAKTWARNVVNSLDNLAISATVALTSFWTCNSSSVMDPNWALREMFSACNFCNVALSLSASSVAVPIWYDSAGEGEAAVAAAGGNETGAGMLRLTGFGDSGEASSSDKGAFMDNTTGEAGGGAVCAKPILGGGILPPLPGGAVSMPPDMDKPSKASEIDMPPVLSKGGGPGMDEDAMEGLGGGTGAAGWGRGGGGGGGGPPMLGRGGGPPPAAIGGPPGAPMWGCGEG